MSFSCMLYRAAPDAGPLFGWEENQAIVLGTPDAVQATLEAALPSMQWTTGTDGARTGTTVGMVDEAIWVLLHETSPGAVSLVSVSAEPGTLRTVMTALALNCCCASESGEMRDPFAVGATW